MTIPAETGGLAAEVIAIGIPQAPHGLLYYREEIQAEAEARRPGLRIRFCASRSDCSASGGTAAFTYHLEAHRLERWLRIE